MVHRSASSSRPLVFRILCRPCALAFALLVLLIGSADRDASAKAPPLATTVLAVEGRSAPALDAEVIAHIPAGSDIELTGEAAPGYLNVYYDGETVWVPAPYLSLGDRPGIDTAVTVADAPLLDAPLRDASVLSTVPEGESVILTGANVDGYDAASHEGVGGWINGRNLAR